MGKSFCKRGVFSIHPIGTKSNVSDIGTKRDPRPRMLYLMFLLGVYDQGCSQRVGSETYDRLTSETLVASSVKQLRATGLPTGTCKSLLRVLLVSALSPMANAMELSSKTSFSLGGSSPHHAGDCLRRDLLSWLASS